MKLRLKLDDLRVETFAPDAPPARKRGTVRANEATCLETCAQSGCLSGPDGCPHTWDDTCGMTCDTCQLGCTYGDTCAAPTCPLSCNPSCIC